ncbi:MAG: GSCFA domain-containing protein [Flavobacteriaceae bacterium]
MTNFRTEITLKKQNHTIDYKSSIVLIGSCFTQNIGDKLNYFKFNTTINPFGILFQPSAIEKFILSSINEVVYTNNDVIFHNERWHCFDAHSSLSNANKDHLLNNLNAILKQTKIEIIKASHIFITLGSSWVYRFIESGEVVANCHKIQQKKFNKELLSIQEIQTNLNSIINAIKSVNKETNIVFTLSPVRHLKDGFLENKQSKAHLLSAIYQTEATYFPAYEIMMDDLRDYRFYKKDMVHPNQIALDYIWDKFITTWISTPAVETMDEINQIQKGLAHKPFNATSEQHHCFLRDLQMKMDDLEDRYGITF